MRFLSLLFLFTLSFNVATDVTKKFNNPEQELIYLDIINELRCLVCQNQTVADSNAELAKDLREQVYDLLQQDKTRDEIIAFMLKRYGDFVLYNPQFKAKTIFLWLGPLVFLLLGLILLVVSSQSKKSRSQILLSVKNKNRKAKIKALLKQAP